MFFFRSLICLNLYKIFHSEIFNLTFPVILSPVNFCAKILFTRHSDSDLRHERNFQKRKERRKQNEAKKKNKEKKEKNLRNKRQGN